MQDLVGLVPANGRSTIMLVLAAYSDVIIRESG